MPTMAVMLLQMARFLSFPLWLSGIPLGVCTRMLVESGSLWPHGLVISKNTTWELRIEFYLGQNEDCSPGDSTQTALRDRSKEAGGKVGIQDFGEGGA